MLLLDGVFCSRSNLATMSNTRSLQYCKARWPTTVSSSKADDPSHQQLLFSRSLLRVIEFHLSLKLMESCCGGAPLCMPGRWRLAWSYWCMQTIWRLSFSCHWRRHYWFLDGTSGLTVSRRSAGTRKKWRYLLLPKNNDTSIMIVSHRCV
jgi:hypothetical protein